jgi:TRAP-type C4-dicarboxylate transport system substrate-binding protein
VSVAIVVAGAAAVCVLGGCGSAGGINKEGAKIAPRQITLTMESPDGPTPDTTYFLNQVLDRTHGQLRVIVDPVRYSSADPANELRLAVALREGRVQMAYIPSRAWELDSRRVLGFRALQAPFLITNYALLRAVTTGPVAQELLTSLSGNGLIGLGLVGIELRRPLGRRPLISATTFRGARIRVNTSTTSVLVLRALGAIPLTNFTAGQVGPALASGRLVGVETSLLDIDDDGYTEQAKYLPSNVALFAKTETIVTTKATFHRLTPIDRAALRAAAAATAAHADPAAEERAELRQFCGSGGTLKTATPSQLASLQRATAPPYATLEQDPATKRAILAIERLKKQTPAANSTLPPCPSASTPTSTAESAFPTGTFETVITKADVAKAGFPPNDAHTETLTFGKNGTWLDTWFDPRESDQPPAAGRYTVRGDVLTFGPPAGPDVVKWSYFRDQLTFKILSVPDAFGQFTYTAHPWRKIG